MLLQNVSLSFTRPTVENNYEIENDYKIYIPGLLVSFVSKIEESSAHVFFSRAGGRL